jgi:hypothetical protein
MAGSFPADGADSRDGPSLSAGAPTRDRRARRSSGGARRRLPGARAGRGSGSFEPATRRPRPRVCLRSGQRHRLGAEAAAIVDPALGVEPCTGKNHPSAREEVVDAIGDLLVRARRIAGGFARPDRSEADDLGKVADRLQQGPAARAQIAHHVGRARRGVQAELARCALEVRHQARFRSRSHRTIHDNRV